MKEPVVFSIVASPHTRKAYEIYEQLAREGDPNCQVQVGWMKYAGHGTKKDEALGLEWFRKAAAVGSAGAPSIADAMQRDLGTIPRRCVSSIRRRKSNTARRFCGSGSHIFVATGWRSTRKRVRLPQALCGSWQFLCKARTGANHDSRKTRYCENSCRVGVLLPYSFIAALIDGLAKGHSEKLMGCKASNALPNNTG